jgi:putative molybdopterin biosynthesis protein
MSYYTIKELAELWRCSTDVIYDLVRNGKLPAFRVGREWRISDEARRQYEQTPAVTERAAPRRRAPVLKIV